MVHRMKVFPLNDEVEAVSAVSLDEMKQPQNREFGNSWDKLCVRATEELRTFFGIKQSIFIGGSKSSVSGMNKLLFYRLLMGGNVPLVLRILDSIKDSDPLLHRCLLLGKAEVIRKPINAENHLMLRCFNFIASVFVYFIFLLPSYLLMTPIFYIIHFMTYSWGLQCKTSDNIRLPLLFAALSNNANLVQLFSEYQPTILTSTDQTGCNIFHYLAHLSTDESRSANSCLDVLLRVFGASAVRAVLLECRNDRGLSGLELAIMVGSPLYFTKILETEGIFRETKMFLGIDQVFVATHLLPMDGGVSPSLPHIHSSGFILSHYDVSLYEDGDVLQEQSFLLSLLYTRDLMAMSQEEVASITNCSLLKNWIDAKIKVNSRMVNIFFLLNAQQWGLLVVYVVILQILDELDLLKITYWSIFDSISDTLAADLTNASSCHQPSSSSSSLSSNSFNANSSVHVDLRAIARCNMSEICGFDVQSAMDEAPISLGFFKLGIVAMLVGSCVFVLVFDGLMRLVFLHLQFFCQNGLHLPLTIRRVFRRRIPMSYVARQLNILFCCFLSTSVALKLYDSSNEVTDVASADMKYGIMCLLVLLVVLAVMFRVLCLLYGTRIHSFGGHFVISMCKMGKVLLQFLSLFLTVASAFAMTFEYAANDPDCRAKKVFPFDDTVNSVSGTFRLMMGDNTLPDPMTGQVALTYAVYVIVANVVMLSLLTGLAGSVADRVLSADLKDILMLMERLEESIDVETLLLFLAFPWRRSIHRWRCRSTQATNMIVKSAEKGNRGKVIIEVEHIQDCDDYH